MGSLENGHGKSHDVRQNEKFKSVISEYCGLMGGDTPISSVLIANNGIAAVKFIRSVRYVTDHLMVPAIGGHSQILLQTKISALPRSWAYECFGSEKAIAIVGMATPDDMRASLEHIRMVDQFVEVPGGANNNNYANVQLIVEVKLPSFYFCLYN